MWFRLCMSLWGCFFLVAVVSVSPVSAADFSGQFEGIGAAAGMALTLEEEDGRVVGRFSSGQGEPFSLNGRRTGEAAQGSVIRPGQRFFFHLEPRPLGVQFLLIPRNPEGGPDIAGGTDYSFVQQGLQVPQPAAFRAAPPRGVQVDIVDFIDAFRDWRPEDMAWVYGGLDSRYKELLQLFDHAAAEVLWRVCVSNPPKASFPSSELERLLERQHTDCASYLAAVASVRDAGLMSEFLRKANFQLELIHETVKCDRGLSPAIKCADVGAMSGPLMARWRRASDIMSSLAGDRASAGEPARGVVPVPATPVVTVPGSAVQGTQRGEPVGRSSVPLPRLRPGAGALTGSTPVDTHPPQLWLPRERP